MGKNVQKLISGLQAADSLEVGGAIVLEIGAAMGLGRPALATDYASSELVTDESGRTLAELFGWPKEAIDMWVNQGYSLSSPLGAACRLARLPFAWKIGDLEHFPMDHLEERQEKVMSFHTELGLVGGVTSPLHQPRGRIGSLTFFTDQDELDLQAICATHQDDLILATVYMFDLIARCKPEKVAPESSVSLTEREIECLTWVALGKTDAEIGIIIGRASSTARFHIEKAAKKLGSVTRTQAAAKAAQLGLIGPVV